MIVLSPNVGQMIPQGGFGQPHHLLVGATQEAQRDRFPRGHGVVTDAHDKAADLRVQGLGCIHPPMVAA